MNEVALQKQIEELTREFRLSGEAVKDDLVELQAAIDRLELEVAAMKTFLTSKYSDFDEKFERILRRTKTEENPEWE
ncbi:MAG: hypothetical protein K9K88_14700 [Desulfobacterales bacterium]|nr:hypothetical protein [Desulfobacterales bacterium]